MDHSSTTSPSRTDPPPCRPRRKILKPAWPLVRRVLPGRTQLCRTLHEYGLERAACLTSTFTCHTLASLNSVDTSWGRTQPPTLLPYYPSSSGVLSECSNAWRRQYQCRKRRTTPRDTHTYEQTFVRLLFPFVSSFLRRPSFERHTPTGQIAIFSPVQTRGYGFNEPRLRINSIKRSPTHGLQPRASRVYR